MSPQGTSELRAEVLPPDRNPPKTIYVRLRHPDAKPIQALTVNGQPHEVDAKKEWVGIAGTTKGPQTIVAKY